MFINKKILFSITCFSFLISLKLLSIRIQNKSGYTAFIKGQPNNIDLKKDPVKINCKQKMLTIYIKIVDYLVYSFGFYITNLKGSFSLNIENKHAYLTSKKNQIKSTKGIPKYCLI